MLVFQPYWSDLLCFVKNALLSVRKKNSFEKKRVTKNKCKMFDHNEVYDSSQFSMLTLVWRRLRLEVSFNHKMRIENHFSQMKSEYLSNLRNSKCSCEHKWIKLFAVQRKLFRKNRILFREITKFKKCTVFIQTCWYLSMQRLISNDGFTFAFWLTKRNITGYANPMKRFVCMLKCMSALCVLSVSRSLKWKCDDLSSFALLSTRSFVFSIQTILLYVCKTRQLEQTWDTQILTRIDGLSIGNKLFEKCWKQIIMSSSSKFAQR